MVPITSSTSLQQAMIAIHMDYYHWSYVYCDFRAIVNDSDDVRVIYDDHPVEHGENHFVEVEWFELQQLTE